MKPYLQNISIECWEHIGRLGTNAPYVCLYRSDMDSVASLLTAIDELEVDGPSSRRSVTFNENGRRRECQWMRLRLMEDCGDLRLMCIVVDGDGTNIDMTLAGLQQLRDAVATWRDGAEDFGLSPHQSRNRRRELGERDLASGELWFWGPTYLGP